MKKSVFFIGILVILTITFISFFQENSETVVKKEDSTNTNSTEKDYQVYLNDDSIYFHDDNGNSVIYNFCGDKVSEAFMLIAVNSIEEAELVREFYYETLDSGDVEEIIAEEDLVTIVYNDSYIKSFENLNRKDIEMLLKSGD